MGSSPLGHTPGLRPYEKGKETYDKLRDYPRKFLSEYDERKRHGGDRVIRTVWRLHPEGISAVEEILGPGCLSSNAIEVSKAYEEEATTWDVKIDLPKVVGFLLEQCGCEPEERQALARLGSTEAIDGELSRRAAPLSAPLQALKTRLESFRGRKAALAAIDTVSKRMPKFLYFSNYDRMSGDVSIDKLRQDITQNTVSAGDAVFRAFLEFAGTTLDELAGVTRFEDLRARVESASIRITRQIFEYWSQNKHLNLNFHVHGRLSVQKGSCPGQPLSAGRAARVVIAAQRSQNSC
jgi:hypothetical protein